MHRFATPYLFRDTGYNIKMNNISEMFFLFDIVSYHQKPFSDFISLKNRARVRVVVLRGGGWWGGGAGGGG